MPVQPERHGAALEAIYDAASSHARWPGALERIAACFDATGAILMQHRKDKRFPSLVSPSMDEAWREYDQGWYRKDIRARRGFELGFTTPHGVFTDRHRALRIADF